ncbi:hypothetical protein HPP92_005596 [Vanilla planifolia]|uniref:Uncharacterized protein n=1 Tax=Vanilla planifolia TaxID=51239 RepID=A0A835VDC2_VANPL|nr:hypothetical protein HPP92_005596 [Vanilla planifolia]
MSRSQVHHEGENNSSLFKYETDSCTIKPRALNIVWGRDSRYWKLSHADGPAELNQVSWLEVNGKINLSRFFKNGKKYMVKFRVELTPDNFGWGESCPVYFMVKVAQEARSWKKVYLNQANTGVDFDVPMDGQLTFRVPERRGADDQLHFGMYEIWRGRWKGGLVIHEVIIAPVVHA